MRALVRTHTTSYECKMDLTLAIQLQFLNAIINYNNTKWTMHSISSQNKDFFYNAGVLSSHIGVFMIE